MTKRENKGRLHREGDADRGKEKKKGEREQVQTQTITTDVYGSHKKVGSREK